MSRTMVALCLVFAGCDDHLFPAPTGGGGNADATWVGVQAFMGDNCYSCHGAAPGSGDILLPDDIVADLGNLEDPVTPYDELVIPGDSENSVLWKAVSFQGDVTGMPISQSAQIPDAEFIQQWIDAGASLD